MRANWDRIGGPLGKSAFLVPFGYDSFCSEIYSPLLHLVGQLAVEQSRLTVMRLTGDQHYHSHTPNQLVLYHPASHALRVRIQPPSPPRSAFPSDIVRANDALRRRSPDSATRSLCLLCRQPVPRNGLGEVAAISGMESYFQTLEHVHSESESFSQGVGIDDLLDAPQPRTSNEENSSAAGYYARFFKEVRKLGMGAEGSVYLAVHHIEGDTLGESLCVMNACLHLPLYGR